MERLIHRFLKYKKTIVVFFIVCTLAGGILSLGVGVNYSFSDYLPEDAPSTKALDTMSEEFTGSVPNARLMVKNITVPEALELKDRIEAIDGVGAVLWMDDVTDIRLPLELIDQTVRDDYYKGQTACFQITVIGDQNLKAVNAIRQVAGKGALLAGTAIDAATARETTDREVSKIMFLVIPLCFLILFLTTNSWFEPVLFMSAIGAAILINMGTNLIFGEVSFITRAASSLLQLAVSMDYSIFLLHRFSEYRKEGLNVENAMVKAIRKSFFTITASGLTTAMGFAALILMEFRIGADMGWVMAKAIALSMVSVLVFLPALALLCYKLIDKTTHRPLMPSFKPFAAVISKIKIPAFLLCLFIMVPAFLAQGNNDFGYGSSEMFKEGSPSYIEKSKVEAVFGKMNQMVLIVPKGNTAKEEKLSEDLGELDHVTGVISYVDAAGAEIPADYLDKETREQFFSKNYSRMIITVNTDVEGDSAFALVDEIRSVGDRYYGQDALLVGESATTADLKEVTTADMAKVNVIAIGVIFLIILLTMRSLSLPILLVLTIEISIWINLSIPYFMGEQLQYMAYLIISTVQLGATVDYAILMANRYVEERRLLPKRPALLKTMEKTTLSILTSASILTMAGFSLGLISSNGMLKAQGILVGRGALLSAIMVIFVLPGILYISDRFIRRTTWKANFVMEERIDEKKMD